jgi:hypothetical protein
MDIPRAVKDLEEVVKCMDDLHTAWTEQYGRIFEAYENLILRESDP